MRIILLLFLINTALVKSQVGINTTDLSPAAALTINSQTTVGYGGLSLPKVTEAQRSQVLTTASSEGTLLFVTYASGDRCLEIYDGEDDLWRKINCFTVGPVTIWEQNFDGNTSWSYSSNVSFFNNGTDGFYGITDGLPASSPDVTMNGNFLGIADLNDEGNGTSGFATITFITVAVSGNNLTLEFDYDIYEFDDNDDVYYTVTINGVDQTEVFFINGSSNLSISGTEVITIPNGTTSIGFKIRIRQNDSSDRAGFDNFKIIRN